MGLREGEGAGREDVDLLAAGHFGVLWLMSAWLEWMDGWMDLCLFISLFAGEVGAPGGLGKREERG